MKRKESEAKKKKNGKRTLRFSLLLLFSFFFLMQMLIANKKKKEQKERIEFNASEHSEKTALYVAEIRHLPALSLRFLFRLWLFIPIDSIRTSLNAVLFRFIIIIIIVSPF